jgi:hypothetical protein
MHSSVANSWKGLSVNFAIQRLFNWDFTGIQTNGLFWLVAKPGCFESKLVLQSTLIICIFKKKDQKILKIVAVHDYGLMNLLRLATLVGGETIKYWENHTATEKTQFQKLPVHPSPTWARPYPVLPLHPYLYTPCVNPWSLYVAYDLYGCNMETLRMESLKILPLQRMYRDTVRGKNPVLVFLVNLWKERFSNERSNQGLHLRTPNPGFNPGFTPRICYIKGGVNPGLNLGFDVLRFGLSLSVWVSYLCLFSAKIFTDLQWRKNFMNFLINCPVKYLPLKIYILLMS